MENTGKVREICQSEKMGTMRKIRGWVTLHRLPQDIYNRLSL